MPIRFTIGTKPARFEGGSPVYNATVSGPSEIFTKQLRRFLFLHGLNALGDGRQQEVWSSRYVVGPPMHYLGSLISQKFGVQIEKDTKRHLQLAIGANPDVVNLGGRHAGDLPLTVKAGGQVFFANCSEGHFARRQYLAGAGWLPIRNPSDGIVQKFGTMPFATRDPFIASNLDPFMDDASRRAVRLKLAECQANMKISQTQDAPADFTIPAPEGLDYLPFQKTGIAQVLKTGKSALIADDMGLGKTIQGIGIINGRPDAKKILVLCQANMRLKWVREIEKWKINPDLSVGHAEGSNWPDTDVVVINYDIADRHVDRIRGRDWDIVLTDEAHNLKNEEAQRTQAVLGTLLSSPEDANFIGTVPLADKGQLVHLTGTPKPNRVSELWPLLTTSRPDIWGTGPEARLAFLNRYQPPTLIKKTITKGKRSFEKILAMPGKPIRELELQMRMRGSGSFIRRLKRDTDLPPKFRTPLPMPYRLSKEDIDMLRSVETELADLMQRAGLADGRAIMPGQSRVATELIDVISGNSLKVDFHEIARVRANLGALKAPMAARFIIDELVAERDLAVEDRRKTVVFAHHKTVIDTIAREARGEFPNGVLVYDGAASAKKRQDMIDRFDADPSAVLMIISLAGATGITLTASSRMRVVEPDYSPSNMVQIEDRIWRIGQMRPVDIGYLFIPDSMDANVGLSLIEKMETDERSINTMSFRGMRATEEVAQPPRNCEIVDTDADCGSFERQTAFTF